MVQCVMSYKESEVGWGDRTENMIVIG
jgi:hypothetical protein